MDEIKTLRKKSWIGLCLFTIGIISGYFYINNLILGLLSIIFMLIGWYIFSDNHTKISSIKIKQITQEYLDEIKELRINNSNKDNKKSKIVKK